MNLELENHEAQSIVEDSQVEPSSEVTASDYAASLFKSENLDKIVEQKYAMLMAGLSLANEQTQRMCQLLLERERILTSTASFMSDDLDLMEAIEQQESQLSNIDDEIGQLLTVEEYERYDLFKDSGLEQYQLTRFADSLSSIDRLNDSQLHCLLMAKLRHKRLFLEAIADAQKFSEAGNVDTAKSLLNRAISQYQTEYLSEVQSVVTQQQHQQLAEFEKTEFDDVYLSLVTPI